MLILGIETSCDETAASVANARGSEISILSNIVSSQTKIHSKWGGVVPNLAAREHLKNILPVIKASLQEAKFQPKDIDLIAITAGPGLIPALLIGTGTAKTLSYIWNKPLLGIHHIEGHIYANFINDNLKLKIKNLKFPILCLVVSGGHTQLILMKKHHSYEIIGETLDDAAGEAFDKVARILKLGYPGGPAIAQRAMEFTLSKSQPCLPTDGFPNKLQVLNFKLPRPMINSKNFNFSFSGLKTAVLYTVKKNPKILKDKKMTACLCAEFQQAVIDVLISKTLSAAKKYNPKAIMLAGGVSANKELRKQMEKTVSNNFPDSLFIIPNSEYCIDNASMIAAAGYSRWKNLNPKQKKKLINSWKNMKTDANLRLKQ